MPAIQRLPCLARHYPCFSFVDVEISSLTCGSIPSSSDVATIIGECETINPATSGWHKAQAPGWQAFMWLVAKALHGGRRTRLFLPQPPREISALPAAALNVRVSVALNVRCPFPRFWAKAAAQLSSFSDRKGMMVSFFDLPTFAGLGAFAQNAPARMDAASRSSLPWRCRCSGADVLPALLLRT